MTHKAKDNQDRQKSSDLRNRIKFSPTEVQFLLRNEACRVATSHNDIPHITPVSYVYASEQFIFATDYDTRKFKNIKHNKNIGIAVDVYDSSMNNRAVIVQGVAKIIERGTEFKKWYKVFNQKFEWVRNDPWDEGEAPFIAVHPVHKVSWGL